MRVVPRSRWGKAFAIIGGLLFVLIVSSIAAGSSKTNVSEASANAPVSAPSVMPTATVAKTPEHTIKFVVTGDPADVTYGHGGSTAHGTVPMHLTRPLNAKADDYSLTAVLGEEGHVSVKILVDGKVISRATADGAYQSAVAVITKNIFTGHWENSLGA